MTDYFIIRLGADSEKEIRRIDSIISYDCDSFSIDINCKQVPKGVSANDVAIIWLGTNNNKGGKTSWVQGVRAVGRIENVSGSGGYSEAKTLRVSIGVVLPKSVTKMDIVTQQSNRYPDIAAMPVLGVNNYSSQVVQRIEPFKPGQNLKALFAALEGILPGLKLNVLSIYPDLGSLFDDNFQNVLQQQDIISKPDDSRESIIISSPGVQQIDDGLDPDEDRGSEIDVPFDPTKIDIVAKPMTISALEDRLDNDELNLTPDFQRQANLWDVKRKSRLIESILLKIPLPSFYFSEDLDGGYAVVDGLQRLCTIFHFKNVALLNTSTGVRFEPLVLKGLQYLNELEGKTFVELERKFQRRISELEITANIIRANTPSAVKFNVFARLNQGGLPLSAQEIRNAIFPGEWRNELRKLAESDIFIDATEGKIQKIRQQDMELVLRFIALWQLEPPYRRPGNQTLDEFLNVVVEQELCKWNSEKWKKIREAFYHSINATCRIRGKHVFRKSGGTQQRSPINRGLFESEMIVYGSLDGDKLSRVIIQKNRIEALFLYSLSEDKDFIQSLLSGTGSAESANIRIATLNRIVEEVLNA